MAIFNILYGNYYRPHREFNLICLGKFSTWTWVNFTQQYGKNRQTCQRNTFYYAVWQLLLYSKQQAAVIQNIPQKFSPCELVRKNLIDYNLKKSIKVDSTCYSSLDFFLLQKHIDYWVFVVISQLSCIILALSTNWRRKKIQWPQTDTATRLAKKIYIK